MNNIIAVSQSPGHHFFGFHDLDQWNKAGDLMLALRVEDISHPPYPDDVAISGVLIPQEKSFQPIHPTHAFNYPQGSRQQWLGDSDLFICNDRINGQWGSRIVDARNAKLIDSRPFPCHCYNHRTGEVFFTNYSRLHRVGGYGYVGIRDENFDINIPKNCGVFSAKLDSGSPKLILSIYQAAEIGERSPLDTGFPHYITHLLLSPNGTRLAFLHRYNVPDGGIVTRLMTMNTDGSDVRLLAKGFLSHFDWISDEEIMIWGKFNRATDRLRESKFSKWPVFHLGVVMAKKILRQITKTGKLSSTSGYAFWGITDTSPVITRVIGSGVLIEDGHPNVCPSDRTRIINDTYPNSQGYRTLMVYNLATNQKDEIGKFLMLNETPDPNQIDLDNTLNWVDQKLLNSAFNLTQFLFTRSGYHCDLHPRWRRDGSSVSFDSIHEGTRQVYMVNFNSK